MNGEFSMSHADGLAILPNGTKYHFEYNGTVDICCTRIYKDYEEMHKNWRIDNLRDCKCEERSHMQVMLSTSYGAKWHFLWESTICLNCMCITGKTHDLEY